MLHGKRSSQWDHTAALITHIRLAAGDKNAKPEHYHPYIERPDSRAEFKKFFRGENKNESDNR